MALSVAYPRGLPIGLQATLKFKKYCKNLFLHKYITKICLFLLQLYYNPKIYAINYSENVNNLINNYCLKHLFCLTLLFPQKSWKYTEKVGKMGKFILYVIKPCRYSKCAECFPKNNVAIIF